MWESAMINVLSEMERVREIESGERRASVMCGGGNGKRAQVGS